MSNHSMSNRPMSDHRANTPRAVRRCVQVVIASLAPVIAWAGAVDINTADAATIAKELEGVGLSRAQAIVAYREKNGAFKSVDDLRNVKGVGARTLEINRGNIRIDGRDDGAKPASKTMKAAR